MLLTENIPSEAHSKWIPSITKMKVQCNMLKNCIQILILSRSTYKTRKNYENIKINIIFKGLDISMKRIWIHVKFLPLYIVDSLQRGLQNFYTHGTDCFKALSFLALYPNNVWIKGALDNILKFYFWLNFIYHVKCNCYRNLRIQKEKFIYSFWKLRNHQFLLNILKVGMRLICIHVAD